jgi:hypothetical protein
LRRREGRTAPNPVKIYAGLDEQRERGLVAGERLHRRAEAEALPRVVDPNTSFRAATRTSPD